jgi:hypothetical protein
MTRVISFVFAVLFLGACQPEKKLTISSVDPKEGSPLGDKVTIKGTGFTAGGQQGLTVYFGNKRATGCIVSSNTEIHCVAPGGGAEGEKVDVQVEFDDARKQTLKQAYTYKEPKGTGGVNAIAP